MALRLVEHIMGLPISLDLRDPAPAPDAVRSAFEWLREVDRRFSPFRADSEVCQVQRGELTETGYSADLAEITELCAGYEAASSGAFRCRPPGRRFDPSGVVKGWAVQRAGLILRRAGARNFCVNAGGDVLAAGGPAPGPAWRVGVRHPDHADRLCAVFAVRDGAVATSGGYERGAHIVDGRTGRPATGLVSLTVLAADLTTADATATAAYAMGVDGIAWAAARPGCQVFAVDAQRRVHRSAGLPDAADAPG